MPRRMETNLICKNLVHKGSFENIVKFDPFVNTFYSYCPSYKTCICKFDTTIDYFEVEVISKEGSCRVGFGHSNLELLGPLGIDSYGYSFGSKNGYGIHKSFRSVFGDRVGKNDIISCIRYKNNIYFSINGKVCSKRFNIENKKDNLFPALSLYEFCEVSLNFGPFFAFQDAVYNTIKK